MKVLAGGVPGTSGPFRRVENRWTFHAGPGGCDVGFPIAYEFKSLILQTLVGGLFDRAFRQYTKLSRRARMRSMAARPRSFAAQRARLNHAVRDAVLDENLERRGAGRAAVAGTPLAAGAENAALGRHRVELDAVVVDGAVWLGGREVCTALVANDHRTIFPDHDAIAGSAGDRCATSGQAA